MLGAEAEWVRRAQRELEMARCSHKMVKASALFPGTELRKIPCSVEGSGESQKKNLDLMARLLPCVVCGAGKKVQLVPNATATLATGTGL